MIKAMERLENYNPHSLELWDLRKLVDLSIGLQHSINFRSLTIACNHELRELPEWIECFCLYYLVYMIISMSIEQHLRKNYLNDFNAYYYHHGYCLISLLLIVSFCLVVNTYQRHKGSLLCSLHPILMY